MSSHSTPRSPQGSRGLPLELTRSAPFCALVRRAPRGLLALLGSFFGLILFACENPEPGATSLCPSVGVAVDLPLLAYLSSARAAHHQADLHENAGDLRAAAGVLQRLVDRGSVGIDRPEVDEVMADTYARLADLVGQLGEFDAAERNIRAGLKLAKAPTYFRGHLWEVRGLVEQKRFQSLSSSGDTSGATAARQRAIEAFEEAMRIQQSVIQGATSAVSSSPIRP